MTDHGVFYAGLALLTGLGIPVMAAMNGTLGVKLGHPALAACILSVVGGLACFSVLMISGAGVGAGSVAKPSWSAVPPAYYFAGLFFAFYILTITWITPRFGVGNAVFFVLLGQLVMASVIDHLGLFGAPKIPLTSVRYLGLILMVVGVLLAKKMPPLL